MENLKTSKLGDLQKNSLLHVEENKQEFTQKDSLFRDMSEEQQKTGIQKQDVVQDVKEEMKQGLAEATVKTEKDLQPVEEEEVPLEDKLFKMAGKFKQKEDGDSAKMKAVRDAMKEFETAKSSKINDKIRLAVNNLITACKSYCFMRFSLFRSERGKQRLAEVKSILQDAKKIEAEYAESTEETTKEFKERLKEAEEEEQEGKLIYQYDGIKKTDDVYAMYQLKVSRKFFNYQATTGEKAVALAGATARFVGYNAVRAVGTAVALPFVAMYTGISKLRQKMSKTYVHRPIDLSWKWKFSSGANQILFNMAKTQERKRKLAEAAKEGAAKKVGYKTEFRSTIESRMDVDTLGIELSKDGVFYTEADGEQLVKDKVITQEQFEALKGTDFFIDEDVMEEMQKNSSNSGADAPDDNNGEE